MVDIFSVEGRVVCITGASRGLGKSIATVFAERGARVVISSWDTEELVAAKDDLTARELQVAAIGADVSDPRACQYLIDEVVRAFGRIDVLVCNAGVDKIKAADSYDVQEWDYIQSVNVRGAYFCAKHAGRAMLEAGKGSIIMTSSVAGSLGIPGLVPYAASKGGMDQLVRTLGVEWAKRGVRVNGVAPGYINNTMIGVDVPASSPYERRVIERTPMGRRGELAEFGGAYLFLASDASSYVTGEILYVDGGYHAA